MSDERLKFLRVLLLGFALGLPAGFVCRGCGVTPPEPKPKPPVVVVDESGPRKVYIIRETEETGPDLAQAVTLLRNGDNAAYFAEKKHTLTILDDDLPEAAKFATGKTSVVVLNGDKVLVNEPLKLVDGDKPVEAKAIVAQVLAALKAHGG